MRAVIVGGLLALLAGCPSATGQSATTLPKTTAFAPPSQVRPLLNVPPFYIPGEVITWEITASPEAKGRKGRMLRNIKLEADAIMAVGKPGTLDGKRIIIVRSRVKFGGLIAQMGADIQQEYLTHINMVDSNVPYRVFKATMLGKIESVEFKRTPRGYNRTRRRRGRAYTRRRRAPRDAVFYDVQSILGVLRAWNPKLGAYASFHALGESGFCHHIVRFTRKVGMKTRLGRLRAVRIDGIVRRLRYDLRVDKYSKARPYTLWLSDDRLRRPVRIAIQMRQAKVLFEITSYKRR